MKRLILAGVVVGVLNIGLRLLPVQARAAQDAATPDEVRILLDEGSALSGAEASALEDVVNRKPDDLESRLKLLSYYIARDERLAMERRQDSPAARKARLAHVIWCVQHQPRHPISGMVNTLLSRAADDDAYYEVSKLWTKQVEANPKDTSVLGNAAAFLAVDRPDEAAHLLQRCLQLEPRSAGWHIKLARIYEQKMRTSSGDDRKRVAAHALEELEQARELSPGLNRSTHVLKDVVTAAFESGQIKKAKGYATKLLDSAHQDQATTNPGQAINDGHLVLGRLALIDGDVAAAKHHLLEAGKTPGSPILNSFGPNMTLAKELLDRGEWQTVLEYFDLCGKFWSGGQDKLRQWKVLVKAKVTPDFGPNLVY